MAAGTFASFALGTLAPLITEELALSRASLGALTTGLFAVGSALSLPAGRLTDAWGGRRVLVGMFLVVAVSLVAVAAAPSYPWLLLGVCVSGVALAAANPVTNKVVAEDVPPGSQGMAMGVKQSGVQAAAFLAGAALPGAALALGWRGAVLASLALPAIGIVLTRVLVPAVPVTARTEERGNVREVWRTVAWLAGYAFLMGCGVAVLAAYLPLYAHEALGLSVPVAGLLAATLAVAAIVARVIWGRIGDRGAVSLPAALALLAAFSVLFQAAIWFAEGGPSWLVWAGAAGTGASAGAWNAVGMLAIVRGRATGHAGIASGIVLLGFYLAYVVSPVAFGYSRDLTGSYDLGWAGVVLAFAAAAVIALRRYAAVDRNPP